MLLQSSVTKSIGSAIFLCIVLLAISSPFIYAGWKNRNRYKQLNSVSSDFSKASINDAVFIRGKISSESVEEIESPFRSKKCLMAMWDICVLKRFGKLDTGVIWSQSCIGIIGNSLTINTSSKSVNIEKLSDTKILGSKEKIKKSLMADSASKFSSVELELDSKSFENKFRPKKELSKKYKDFIDKIRFSRPTKNSYTYIGKILCKLRTPRDTTRFREKIFKTGDEITLLGKKSENGIIFEKCENISPLITSKTRSKILRKYQIAYIFQLYVVPVLCILFSALMGYAAYL